MRPSGTSRAKLRLQTTLLFGELRESRSDVSLFSLLGHLLEALLSPQPLLSLSPLAFLRCWQALVQILPIFLHLIVVVMGAYQILSKENPSSVSHQPNLTFPKKSAQTKRVKKVVSACSNRTLITADTHTSSAPATDSTRIISPGGELERSFK